MISHLTEGFLLGIATGTTCLATCGPIYAPYLMQYGRNILRSLLALCEISVGRFVTYLLIGALAGYAGSRFSFENREPFTAVAYILFSIYLIFSVVRTHKHEKKCAVHKWYAFVDRPIILGILTGINFCPSFLIALTKAVDLSGPLAGMAFFAAFFVGTTIFLIPLSFFGVAGQQKLFRLIARAAALGVAIWFIVHAIIMLAHSQHVIVTSEKPAFPIVNLMDGTPAYLFSDDTATAAIILEEFKKLKMGSLTLAHAKDSLADSSWAFILAPSTDSLVVAQEFYTSKRFVCTISALASNPHKAKNQVSAIASYLSQYHFKVDPDSGTFFAVPQNVLNAE